MKDFLPGHPIIPSANGLSGTQLLKHAFLFYIVMVCFVGCSDEESVDDERVVPITTATAVIQHIDILEPIVGELNSQSRPIIVAETAGKVESIWADAGMTVKKDQLLVKLEDKQLIENVNVAQATIQRLEALLENQTRVVKRLENLLKQDSATEFKLDEAIAQQKALAAQLMEANARHQLAKIAVDKTSVRSPFEAVLHRNFISVGSYLKVGDPLAQLIEVKRLRAMLPYPEDTLKNIKSGAIVYLFRPDSDMRVKTTVTEIRPLADIKRHAAEVIADFENPGDWRPGYSVNAEVLIESRESLMVPELSVVQRPAGDIVYVVQGNKVKAKPVKKGVYKNGDIEIIQGLQPDDIVAVNGANYLTDGVKVTISSHQQ